jgi:hypothetical protein
MSSQRYQEFIAERTRLLERIRELEAENAELKKRLGEPVNPVPPASSSMQNLSLQEKIDLFCSLFKGRDDVFASSFRYYYAICLLSNVYAVTYEMIGNLSYTYCYVL